MWTRTLFLAFAAGILATAAAPVDRINQTREGVALHGYDAVAYFTESKPVKGSPQFTAEWEGATWHFQSAANRDEFRANPAKYAPQYGGYCAWAVSRGYTADVDPTKWKVVAGRLYLNHPRAYASWLKEIPSNIEKADRNWPGIATR